MSTPTSASSTGWNTMVIFSDSEGNTTQVDITKENRPWNQPQLKNSGIVAIHDETHCIPGLNEFDMANSHSIRVKAYCDAKVNGSFPVHIDSWSDSIFYSGGVSLVDVCDCDRDIQAGTWSAEAVTSPKPLQEFRGEITFRREFAVAPTCIVWLTGFDFEKGKNFRIKAEATDITPTGFSIKVKTWYDSILYWASASWIAYYPDSPRIKSGSYSTNDVRPWDKPQISDSGKVKFAGASFPWAPLCFIGVNMFDIAANKGTSIRWKATSDDVTKDGFTWHLDSWYDTCKYSMGASYLALEVGPSGTK